MEADLWMLIFHSDSIRIPFRFQISDSIQILFWRLGLVGLGPVGLGSRGWLAGLGGWGWPAGLAGWVGRAG